MAYFGEDMDLDPYEGDDYFLNLGLFGDEYGDLTPGQRALSSLPGILRGIYARGRELSGNAGGYEDQDGDGIADGIYSGQGGLSASPVSIVQRNEAGEQIGIVQGVRIGYGDNARVVTLDELASINEIRRRSGQDIITTSTPGFVPELVDESGAPVDNSSNTADASSNVNTVSSTDTSEVGGGGPPRPTTPTPSIYGIEGGGGGTRIITLPGGRTIPVPEGLNPLQLLVQGYITKEIYKQETGEDAPDITQTNQTVEPVELVQETGEPLRKETMTDAELNGLDPNFTGEDNGQQYENGMLVSSGDTTQTSSSTATGGTSDALSTSEIGDTTLTGGDTNVSTGATTLTGGDSTLTGGDLYGGDVSTGDTSLTTGATTLTGGAVTTGPVSTDVSSTGGQGGAGGNVSVNIGGGSGLSSGEITEILETSGITGLIAAFADRGEITPGQLQDIFPEAVSTIKSGAPKEFAEEVIALDREIAPQQAGFATDLYGQITGAVRDAQSPLMQSLARRSEMQGAEAERLMGPMSFIKSRDTTQAGYGQAVSGGRGLGNIREMLAGRQQAEQKNVDLQLASNLIGQQRATAGLMADIEGGIYSQIAPNIGIDPNALLNVSGTDIGNRLSLIQSTQRAEAIRDSGDKQLAAEFAGPVVGGLLDLGIGYGKKKLGIS